MSRREHPAIDALRAYLRATRLLEQWPSPARTLPALRKARIAAERDLARQLQLTGYTHHTR